MFQPDMVAWLGRDDSAEGPAAVRWHQRVQPLTLDAAPGFALLGFASNEGVLRNQGRVGAAGGPRAIRKALANLAWHESKPLFDAGDVECADGDLESAQERLSIMVAATLAAGHFPLVLGGGHDTAWGTFLGLARVRPGERIGVINLDAHFDLRPPHPANSGSAFLQMALWSQRANVPFRYLCLGVNESANTKAAFDLADNLKVQYRRDRDLVPWRLKKTLRQVDDFIDGSDVIYLSVDLDVLPGALMAAVSAPSGRGVALESIEQIIGAIAASGKLSVADVVEFNPNFDPTGCCARVAAGLVWTIVHEKSAASS